MRIGLLTYHWVANYGANLQALSTYCYLDNNGYNPIIINWGYLHISPKYITFIIY